ncbi:diguanylate cyclase [Methylobacterium sp. Leaf456]|uniref:GGDEF domain-containing protein n=1 Tax=Methylobacterium sp. Leaf456 TaxID=1736382 RepID=UPI0006F61B7A|nr:GGDEF domain-containing protein [Methylobacterium sp. Leaf456]KQT60807.1 diguanylate cyclase [Methylobacterium sp. Leaf456]
MRDTEKVYSPPRTRLARWLAEPGADVPEPIRLALIANLYGTLPIFVGGVANTILVAAVIAARLPTPPILAWLVMEVAVCLSRLAVLVVADRAARAGRPTPTDLNLMLAVAWAGCLGYGTFVSLVSGDWVAATLACLSSAAMVGGTCFRNFSAPRLTGVMIALTLGPCCLGAALSGEPLLAVTFVQIPFYLLAMTKAAYRLNGLLVATMRAERENAALALHDGLTGLANRAGLNAAFERHGHRAPGLLYLDLDGFKAINDTHGHAMGDRLLRSVAERIAEAAGSEAVAARIGGDEFVVLCPGRARGALIDLGERLIARIAAPHPIGPDGQALAVGASVGIATAPEHGTGLAALMRAADSALYRAKSLGKGRCSVASRKAAESVSEGPPEAERMSA